MEKYELIEDDTRLEAGDEIVLRFWDDPPWLQLDIFKATAAEFALEVLQELRKMPLDVGTEPYELNLLPLSSQGFDWTDDDGDPRVGAIVRARINDLRPVSTSDVGMEQQASFATGAKLVVALAFSAALLFTIRPVLVEARRVVRGLTDEERAEQPKGPAISTVVALAIVVGGSLLFLYLAKRGTR